MAKPKPTVLFIVEGGSDETALKRILKKLYKKKEINFEVTDGDITSDESVNVQNVEEKIFKIDTREYVGMLKELTEEGKEVSMLVFGSSMAPFLIHARDMIYFKKPDRELQKGDIVFFRRKSGQFVMHRIWKIRPEGYYIVGDAQTQIEGPVKREQIFALITKVRRKEKWLEPGDFWWEFFEHVWLHMIPLRRGIMWCYAKVIK